MTDEQAQRIIALLESGNAVRERRAEADAAWHDELRGVVVRLDERLAAIGDQLADILAAIPESPGEPGGGAP